ncbi:uncharacterized protein LOC134280486 [Saccostrea cucullata]|uniref:uncharacterized protein LOC134280486 n=1 Tax=Saccostrea cuccullata TaxID=36930 RepID=UPI002ED40B48
MSSQHYLLGNKGAHVYTGNQFQCELCKRTYKSFKTLTNHKCSYCPTCKKIFSTYQKFQIHKTSTCRYNELHTYETKLENSPLSIPEQGRIDSRVSKAKDIEVRCTVKDVASLVGDGTTDITDDVVCSALELMRENYTQRGVEFIGYYTPAEMKPILTTKDKTLQKPIVPNDQLCINIHHIAGHWMTSYQQPNQGINVFDSLMSQKKFVDVLPQLQIIYGEDCVTRVKYPAVTQQSTQPICGIMAIAFAFSCFLDIDCTQINFDISVAASHLRKCLSMKKVSLFPVQSTDLLMSSADSYMANQVCQKEQNRIRQKQHREMSLSSDEAIRLQREKDKIRQQKKRKNLNDAEKLQQQILNKKQHQKRRKRLDETQKQLVREKQQQREKNKRQHSQRRSTLDESQKEAKRDKDKKQHQVARNLLDESQKQQLRDKDKRQHNQRRNTLDESKKQKQLENDRKQHREKRSDLTIETTIENFLSVITKGPDCCCVSCKRLLYRTAVVCYKQSSYPKVSRFTLSQWCHINEEEDNNKLWICQTCHFNLKKGNMPSQCIANGLQLDCIPPILKELCPLEIQLISKTLPFMKIVAQQRGAQHKLSGQVVLVPSDLSKVVNALPRTSAESQIITLALKRRLSDKHAVHKQCIRPQHIIRALQYLKANSPYYKDIDINEYWTCDLPFTQENANIAQDDTIVDSEDEVDEAAPAEVREHIQQKEALNYVTCFQPTHGPTVGSDAIINIAPAEGQRPSSTYTEPNWEYLAFPHLFPHGKNSINVKRVVKLSEKKYANVRLLSTDTRFSECPEYVFQMLDLLEKQQVQNSISITTRKSYHEDISVGQLKDPTRFHRLLTDDHLYATFKTIRGTPQYWQQMQLDMLAKLRQLGPYTFFLTGSAAEFHWPEVIQVIAKTYGTTLTVDDINAMDWNTKRQWLQRNPVIAARQIDYIFEQLWTKVILSGAHPIGQILNYDLRKEMQGRGTEHFHSAIHVKDAPRIDINTDEECIAFIDTHIKCHIPSEDDPLHDLVVSRQTHHHTRTCRKNNTRCRFGYPRCPTSKTVISRVPNTENSAHLIENSSKIQSKVYTALTSAAESNVSFEEVLQSANITEEDYINALKISKNRTTVIMKRSISEVYVNNYNPYILQALRSNMDIQFITNVWACIAYLTSYICKPERSMSEMMRKACKESENKSMRDALRDIGDVFRKSREVSEHEAIARILSFPLRKSNTEVLFIQTDFKENRTRLIKPRYILEKMEDDDTDLYVASIHEKYSKRPDDMENLCLAEFGSHYDLSKSSLHEDYSHEEEVADSCIKNTISLKDGMGTITKRKKSRFIRYHYVSKERDEEMYYHRLLLLYMPWRSESQLKSLSYKEKFLEVKSEILSNITLYEPFYEEVEAALEDYDPNEASPEIWNELASSVEQEHLEELEKDGACIHPYLDPSFLPEEVSDDGNCQEPRQYSIGKIQLVSDPKFYEMIRSLNEKQRLLFDYLYFWATRTRLSTDSDSAPKPFYIFLSGGGGVGKTHVVNAIYEGLSRALRQPGHDPDKPTILMTASTGKAASNINGTTLHSAFCLPVKEKSKLFEFKKLSLEKLNFLRSKYIHLKVIIADEISMFGATSLEHLHLTLQDIFTGRDSNNPFGGISVLAVGDLLQLNPVGDRAVFKPSPNTDYSALVGSLWQQHFRLYELTEIVRQKGDPQFAEVLSRVRTGETFDEDILMLKDLQDTDTSAFPKDAVHLYMTNSQVDEYNIQKLQELPTPHVTVKARDSKHDLHTNLEKVTINSTNLYQTGGLPSSLTFAKGARLMLTKNYDIADHLVNGVIGTLVDYNIPSNNKLNGQLYMKFEKDVIGKNARKSSPPQLKDTVPIQAISVRFLLASQCSVPVERKMYPVTLAYALTAHKSQGSTYEYMIADFTRLTKSPPPQGLAYTMISRATSRQGIKIVNFNDGDIKVNKDAFEEMHRMRRESQLSCSMAMTEKKQEELSIGHINIRTLAKHAVDLQSDIAIQKLDILCVSETHIRQFQNNYNLQEHSAFYSITKHGIAIYVSNKQNADYFHVPSSDVCQAMAVHIRSQSLLIVALYRPPGPAIDDFLQCFQALLMDIDSRKISYVILGDFNLDPNNAIFASLLSKFNLSNIIHGPTHVNGNTLDLILTKDLYLRGHTYPVPYTDHHVVWTSIHTKGS